MSTLPLLLTLRTWILLNLLNVYYKTKNRKTQLSLLVFLEGMSHSLGRQAEPLVWLLGKPLKMGQSHACYLHSLSLVLPPSFCLESKYNAWGWKEVTSRQKPQAKMVQPKHEALCFSVVSLSVCTDPELLISRLMVREKEKYSFKKKSSL